MASFSAGTTFTDGVANDVTAAKLGALVNNATPTSGLIQDRTAETVVATNDTFLIGDASDSNTLKRMTVANVMKAELTGTINTTAGTITTLNSTTGTITTCVIPTLTSITKITSGTGTAAAPAISPTGDTNTGIFFPAADTIAFSDGGAEAMRIDSSGNVGIGTTSVNSAYKLDARGWIRAQHPSGDAVVAAVAGNTTGVSSLYFGDSADDNPGSIEYNHTSNSLYLTTNTTERLRIDSSGNVGIGTNSPATYMSAYSGSANGIVIADSGIPSLIFADTASTTYSVISQNGTSLDLFNNAAGSTNFYTNGTERLRIDSSGRVGVGTSSPRGRFDASDALLSGETGAQCVFPLRVTVGYGGSGYGTIGYNLDYRNATSNNTGVKYLVGDTISQLDFDNGGFIFRNATSGTAGGAATLTERLRIDSDGDVSIGTATALSKLHVHGNITLSNTTTATSAGTSTITPPATVAGYLTVSINGTSRKIPYYAT